uniref:Putative secreted protein n=1 Tax=Anopheles darlingi TaxID=43151 RepID=A0A2M4D3B9_ANODA
MATIVLMCMYVCVCVCVCATPLFVNFLLLLTAGYDSAGSAAYRVCRIVVAFFFVYYRHAGKRCHECRLSV